jgi:hypothetical protein
MDVSTMLVIGGLLLLILDGTHRDQERERVNAGLKHEVKRLNRRLIAMKMKYKNILKSMPEGIAIYKTTAQGVKIEFSNALFTRMLQQPFHNETSDLAQLIKEPNLLQVNYTSDGTAKLV